MFQMTMQRICVTNVAASQTIKSTEVNMAASSLQLVCWHTKKLLTAPQLYNSEKNIRFHLIRRNASIFIKFTTVLDLLDSKFWRVAKNEHWLLSTSEHSIIIRCRLCCQNWAGWPNRVDKLNSQFFPPKKLGTDQNSPSPKRPQWRSKTAHTNQNGPD